ncbi:MAG: aminotransferase class I/II-fold pyridoxal phosphate-dependent enzyme, partial [Planctomycetota bacterium]|nr:aminotransferase class I/II-fold pyridoxal phosphate-dependent enzyme [Planctomycetota bacterium]
VSIVKYMPNTLLLGGFSKSYAMTGWRLGYACGDADIIAEMTKLQQFTFVCAPSVTQRAALGAFNVDMSPHVTEYRKKRDFLVAGLRRAGYDCEEPGGAFYLFPRVPARYGNSQAFIEEAISRRLLLVPGHVFSSRDTHFRISYAAPDERLAEAFKVFEALA